MKSNPPYQRRAIIMIETQASFPAETKSPILPNLMDLPVATNFLFGHAKLSKAQISTCGILSKVIVTFAFASDHFSALDTFNVKMYWPGGNTSAGTSKSA